jgi:hypothetical protein
LKAGVVSLQLHEADLFLRMPIWHIYDALYALLFNLLSFLNKRKAYGIEIPQISLILNYEMTTVRLGCHRFDDDGFRKCSRVRTRRIRNSQSSGCTHIHQTSGKSLKRTLYVQTPDGKCFLGGKKAMQNGITLISQVYCEILLKNCVRPIIQNIRCLQRFSNNEFLQSVKSWLNSPGRFISNPVAWVHERTILTERPPLVGEVSANLCE